MVREFISQPAARAGLECIHKTRQSNRWRHLDQQMNVVGLAIDFNHSSSPCLCPLPGLLFEVHEHGRRQALLSILRDNNQMIS